MSVAVFHDQLPQSGTLLSVHSHHYVVLLLRQAWLTWRPTRDTSVQSFVRCRRARALMLRYLNNTGDRRVTVFTPALRYSLQRHLAIGKGENLVRQAQQVAIQVSLLRHLSVHLSVSPRSSLTTHRCCHF